MIVTVYLKSGQILVVDHVEQFKLERGATSKVTWKQDGRQKVTLDALDPQEIVAFTSQPDSWLKPHSRADSVAS